MEKSKFISEQLSALKVQMEDLKVEDKMTHNDHLHEGHFRRGGNKRSLLDKVSQIEYTCTWTASFSRYPQLLGLNDRPKAA